MKLQQPQFGLLDQGTIFSCARADRYPDKIVFGLAITARCDIAQDKYPVLNYLPLVALDDWLCIDGCEIIHARALADARGGLLRALRQAKIAESILNTLTPRQVHDEFFKAGKLDKQSEPFLKFVVALELLDQNPPPTPESASKLSEAFPAIRRAILRDLVLHRLTGYYFLPQASEGNDRSGWVLLLREPNYLPRSVSKLVANGADKSDETLNADPASRFLGFSRETFAMPVGQVPSPEIEHILQTFSSLFGRIGLPDLEPSYIDEITAREPPKF